MNEKAMAPLMTSDAGQRGRRRRGEAPPAPQGGPPPMTNAELRGRSPREYCTQNATAEEWVRFAASVAARIAAEPAWVWQRCRRCGYTGRRPYRSHGELTKPDACIMCNYSRAESGGWMRDMSEAEVKQHQTETAAREAMQAEREERAALYRANESRGRQGLALLSLDEFREITRREFERRRSWGVRTSAAAAAAKPGEPVIVPPAARPDLTLEQDAGGTIKAKSNLSKGAKK